MNTPTVLPRRPATCRCPACNPLHHPSFQGSGSAAQRRARAAKAARCHLCKGSGEVATDAAARYLAVDPDGDGRTVNYSPGTYFARLGVSF